MADITTGDVGDRAPTPDARLTLLELGSLVR
jgi:hypothetical protein